MNLGDWLLSLFSKNPRIVDPVFGALRGTRVEYRGDHYICWVADRQFTSFGESAGVSVFSDESGPTHEQRALYIELRQRYPQLREMITQPLALEYESVRSTWKLESAVLHTPSEIWKIAQLSRIEINDKRHRNSDFVLDHTLDWDADHDLNVAITNWKVVEVMLEG